MCYFLIVAENIRAGQINSTEDYSNPKIIIDDVHRRGAKEVVFELYSKPAIWNSIMHNIALGTESWLKVAVAIHPGTDAATSEMLNLNIGEALEKSPENVFRFTLPVFQLENICSAPDIDDNRYSSYDAAIKTIELRQRYVSNITDSELMKFRNECIQLLEKSKDGIAQFYGISRTEKAKQKSE
jgi:hypothetical protein